MKCIYCNGACRKKGFCLQKQRYQCTSCGRYQQDSYVRPRINENQKVWIVKLNNEGTGISSIGRLIGIAKSSVARVMKSMAREAVPPVINESGQEYEIDELQTYVARKANPVYIMYAINKQSNQVIHCIVGRRTKENLAKVVGAVNRLNPKRIFTDALNIYPTLIDKDIHINRARKINHIERMNLTLRTHLKRLNRKTICYSKSQEILESCLRIYWWKRCDYLTK